MQDEAISPLLIRNLISALGQDPFYLAMTEDFAADSSMRDSVLGRYFEYSIVEGRRLGRCVVAADGHSGAAVWLLPMDESARKEASAAKKTFLAAHLGPRGMRHYDAIISFMLAHAKTAVGESAWYLSIIGVDPKAQGQGLGAQLLNPTLNEADALATTCYLETFNPRALGFYERLGFQQVASYVEPTIASKYWIMHRLPAPTKVVEVEP
jgi:ribosomal protein S18 acetylase RimI-like enzyme